MNKSIIKLFLLGGLTITSITSCTDNYMDYNKNPYEVTDDEMERDAHKLGAALVGMQSVIVPVGEHLAQFSECLLGGVSAAIWQTLKHGEIRSHILISQKIGTERSIWISCLKFTPILQK